MRETRLNRASLGVPACAALVLLAGVAPLAGAFPVYDFDVTGIQSWDSGSQPSNERFVVDLAAELGFASGTPIEVTGIGWDVTLTAGLDPFGESYLRDMYAYLSDVPDHFFDPLFDEEVLIQPAVGAGFGGTGSYTSAIQPLSNFSGDGVLTLEDGLLYLMFNEVADNAPGFVDGRWDSGFLRIEAVPAPSSLALLGLGGIASVRRRRR